MSIISSLERLVAQVATDLYGTTPAAGQIQLQKTRSEFEGQWTLVQIVKGFLNLSISPSAWMNDFNELRQDKHFGHTPITEASPLIMVEYSSPNTNKPLHLGHVRNNLLGYSISKILEAAGNKVFKTNIVNDRGIHICKSMLAWKRWGNGATPESTGKKGDHLIGDFYVLFDKHYKEELNRLMAEGKTKQKQPPH